MTHAQTPRSAYDVLLVDHAVGALDRAATLLVNTHLRMRPERRVAAGLGDVVGGALLERMEPVAMDAFPLARGVASAAAPDEARPEARAQRLIALAKTDPAAIAWRWRWFGVSDHALPVEGARLLRMQPRSAAPRHTHKDHELTLVLAGAFVDEVGAYEPGDLVVAGPGDVHRPRTLKGRGCLCLTAHVGASAAAAVRARLEAGASPYLA